MAPTPRDLAVWSAAIGSALKLPQLVDYPDEAAALAKAQAALDDGKTTGVASAITKALPACAPIDTLHPVRQAEAQRACINLEAALAGLGGAKAAPADDDVQDDDGLDALSVKELKAKVADAGIETKARKKADLIAALRSA